MAERTPAISFNQIKQIRYAENEHGLNTTNPPCSIPIMYFEVGL